MCIFLQAKKKAWSKMVKDQEKKKKPKKEKKRRRYSTSSSDSSDTSEDSTSESEDSTESDDSTDRKKKKKRDCEKSKRRKKSKKTKKEKVRIFYFSVKVGKQKNCSIDNLNERPIFLRFLKYKIQRKVVKHDIVTFLRKEN